WTAVCTNKRAAGYIPQGSYKIDGHTTLQFDLKNCPLGVSVYSDSMGNTVLDGTTNTANPPFFIGGTGGTSSAPTLTNYSSFVGLTFRGDLAGPTLQLGRNGTGVGLADALDSMEFRNLISTNACSSHSSNCSGVEVNNVVSSKFTNVAFN